MSRFVLTAVAVFLLASLSMPATAQTSFAWVQDDIDVYNMQVVRVSGRRLTVRITELGGRHTFQVPRGFHFYIDGQRTDVTALERGQRLTAYVTRAPNRELVLVDAGVPQATPPATPAAPPVVAVQAPEPAPAVAMLPKTGSPLPLIGLGGLLALITAFGIRLVRTQR